MSVHLVEGAITLIGDWGPFWFYLDRLWVARMKLLLQQAREQMPIQLDSLFLLQTFPSTIGTRRYP